MSSSDLRSRLEHPDFAEPTNRVERLIAAIIQRLFAAILALLDQAQDFGQTPPSADVGQITPAAAADAGPDLSGAGGDVRRIAGFPRHPRTARPIEDLDYDAQCRDAPCHDAPCNDASSHDAPRQEDPLRKHSWRNAACMDAEQLGAAIEVVTRDIERALVFGSSGKVSLLLPASAGVRPLRLSPQLE